MKLSITKIVAEPVRGGGLIVRKTVDDPRIGVVEDRSVLTLTALQDYLKARGWYYAGRGEGGFVYRPKERGATNLVINL
jgi:hypothetical protein